MTLSDYYDLEISKAIITKKMIALEGKIKYSPLVNECDKPIYEATVLELKALRERFEQIDLSVLKGK